MTDDTQFSSLADAALNRIFDALEEGAPDCDVELADGILTLTLEGGGQYILNRHAPTRQLWLSSPVSGAHHFAFDEKTGLWNDTRKGEELFALLSRELGPVCGGDLVFWTGQG